MRRKVKRKCKASQKRSKESRPLSGKASYDQLRFPDRLQKITACCRFMQPIGKKLVTAMDWQQEPIEKKLVLEFFVKIIYATPLV